MQQKDGPTSPHFSPVSFKGTMPLSMLQSASISENMKKAIPHATDETLVAMGIPFKIGDVILLAEEPVEVVVNPFTSRWLVFLHTSDERPLSYTQDGFISPTRGAGQLGEHAADYVIIYEDGTEEVLPIRRRFEIGAFQRGWGENCFLAVAAHKSQPIRAHHEQPTNDWGGSQTRASSSDWALWTNWLCAWENPHPEKAIVRVRFVPVSGAIIVSALSSGDVTEHPLRWCSRQKALLRIPDDDNFNPELDKDGLLSQIQMDMGQVISALPRLRYPNTSWSDTYNNQLPVLAERDILLEYTAHPDACFHISFAGKSVVKVPVHALLQNSPPTSIGEDFNLNKVPDARQRVKLRVVESAGQKPVAVKLHIHGAYDEYLTPIDRHRIINPAWFEDYSTDFIHRGTHQCTYISGEAQVNLPLGQVYIEVSKGFEMRPVRKVYDITAETEEIVIEIDRVLHWRDKGWVTADTHVHFLSPMTALLEGAAEGVNIINLLASQWGELMTNVGDFDGHNTWGTPQTGGDGEYLVRVGTENRQHIMGHISLLGYDGQIIAPMTTGGPDESAIGDPIEILLTEWARQCKKQGGLVVLPHFPNPRAEHAASIISGDIDALEMTSWGDLYSGINPYSLSDWYRYLNCGYMVAAVGGTDKMTAQTAVGTVRTYAHIGTDQAFTYQRWMDAVRRAETFVTYGPLLEFSVDGKPMGSCIEMKANGGTVDISWQVASTTVPMTRVELIVNGEIRESLSVAPDNASGHWSFKVSKSSWLALLVRGCYADKPEIIAAHSSPVMVKVEGTEMMAAADALTILEQIEGALAYLNTIGTRAEVKAYKRMQMVLESAHRSLHNRMHRMGYFHNHSAVTDHPEHHV
jgi:hypothetical protein